MIDLTTFFWGAITIFFGLVARYLIPWLKAKVGAEKLDQVAYWVGVLVSAAEQLYKGTGQGAKKLAWVQEQLAAMGFTMDAERIRALIEAQVRELVAGNVIMGTTVEVPGLAEQVVGWQKEAPPEDPAT